MRLLSDEDAVQWISGTGFRMEGSGPYARIQVDGSGAQRLRIRIPEEATAVVGLAYLLVMAAVRDYDEDNFAGALVWLRRWEIWGESTDRAGYILLDGVRASVEQPAPLGTAPAHLFESREFAKAHATLSLPMMFQWDAHFVAAGAEFCAYISHEGSVDLLSRNTEVHRALTERLQQWESGEVSAS